MRIFANIVMLWLFAAFNLQGQWCQLLGMSVGGGLGVQEKTADAIRDEILKNSGLAVKTGPEMFAVINNSTFGGTAEAETCRVHEEYKPYIFYDPNWLGSLRTQRGTDWPKYFVLAHEIGHHQNFNTFFSAGLVRKTLELDADRWASHALTHMGAPMREILEGLDQLRESGSEYPTRSERRITIIDAYDEEAEVFNRQGAHKQVYEMCGDCLATDEDRTAGYYVLSRLINAGATLAPSAVQRCGSKTVRDVPRRSFPEDLSGMCVLQALPEGSLLTWENIGVCGLMHQ
jgi:hypothetical protein